VDQGYAQFSASGSWDGSNGRPYGNFSPLPDTGVWQCPSVAINQRLNGCGYGINENHMQWYGGSAKLEQLYHASDRLMIADSQIEWSQNVFLSHYVINCPDCVPWNDFYGDCNWSNPRSLATRHLERGNIAFADGHIESWVYDDAYQNKNNLFAHDEDGDGKSDW
jgi:prepilin-type processing-associated H-X9-DG protein